MEDKCYVCGCSNWLECHHVYGGSNRKHSTKYNMLVKLCAEHHRGNYSPHMNRELDLKLKREYQQKFESEIGTREEFIKIFGKSWIWE